MSLPRFEAVLFPLFMWLGLVAGARPRRARRAAVLGVSAAGCWSPAARSSRPGTGSHDVRAVLLDAMGTLSSSSEPRAAPASPSCARARRRGERGPTRGGRCARRSRYYRAHHDDGGRRAGLADLRRRCAARARAASCRRARCRPATSRDALLGAIRFRPYPEVPGVLAALRARGVARVVVSQLGRLAARRARAHAAAPRSLDAVVTSAEFGAAKPDPAIFAHALALARRDAGRGACTRATTSRPTSRAPAPRASRPCSSRATASRRRAGVRTVRTLEALLAAAERSRVPSVRGR